MKRLFFAFVFACFVSFVSGQNENAMGENGARTDEIQGLENEEFHISQVSIEGFWGLKFGISQSEVLSELLYKVSGQTAENLYLDNVTFGGNLYHNCLLSFYEDQLYQGVFEKAFKTTLEMINTSNKVIDSIRRKYGNYNYSENEESTKNYYAWYDDSENSILVVLDSDLRKLTILYTCDRLDQQTR